MTEHAETVELNDLDGFVRHLVLWHTNRVQQLDQLMDVPEGVEIRFTVDGEEVVLAQENRKAFIAGMVVAKDLLGELPFTLMMEEDTAEAQV